MRLAVLLAAAAALLAACAAPSSGVLVSNSARPVGGNLYIEPAGKSGGILVLDGEIGPETARAFTRVVSGAGPKWLVIAQSPGGHLASAHAIGDAIAREGMSTSVLAMCASACVDVFVAGSEREIAPGAVLLMHAASNRVEGWALDEPYWRRRGFPEVNARAYQVPTGAFWQIGPREAMQLRLATRVLAD